ncbi:hypothetical protein [Streptomyces sp. GbtcB6]|nr:hypothetical protein [Streptomyces sp. GbtcB6]
MDRHCQGLPDSFVRLRQGEGAEDGHVDGGRRGVGEVLRRVTSR